MAFRRRRWWIFSRRIESDEGFSVEWGRSSALTGELWYRETGSEWEVRVAYEMVRPGMALWTRFPLTGRKRGGPMRLVVDEALHDRAVARVRAAMEWAGIPLAPEEGERPPSGTSG